MNNIEKKSISLEEMFELLDKAAKEYATYLEINTDSFPISEDEIVEEYTADYTNPLTATFRENQNASLGSTS